MLIKYLGHSCFLLRSDSDSISILTDPYKSGAYGGAIAYAPITEEADICVLSHEHEDHADIQGLANRPLTVRTSAVARGVEFDIVDTFHDNTQGSERGPNRITCFTLDGIRLCHMGDLGHVLSDEQAQKIGEVDVVMIPVGGGFTIGPEEAQQVLDRLQPKIAVPMHFKTNKCAFPIEPVESFLKLHNQHRRSPTSEVHLKKEDLPASSTILFIPPSN